MSLRVAVDGGQSGIRMMVSGEGRQTTTRGVSRLEADGNESVVDAVGRLWRDRPKHVDRLVAGLTTIPADERERQTLADRLADVTGAADVQICGDEVTSHAGAFSGRTGVAVSVGTGIACLALNAETGAHRSFDGAGYLIGDEGGGFWIGRRGIRAALASHEGRCPETSLTSALETEIGPLETAAARLHEMPRAVNFIAHMAPIVLAEADAGDAVALDIVSDAATRLTRTVIAALSFLTPEESAPVAIDGRLLLEENPLRTMFLSGLEQARPTVHTVDAPGSSLVGAMWLAENEPGSPYTELLTTSRTKP